MKVIVEAPHSQLLIWFSSFFSGMALFLFSSQILGIRTFSTVVTISLFTFIVILSIIRPPIWWKTSIHQVRIIISGFFLSCLIIEVINQFEGFWPSVFWVDVVFVLIVTSFMVLSGFREYIYWNLGIFTISIAAMVDSILRLVDPYQTMPKLGILRASLWTMINFSMIWRGEINKTFKEIGVLIGSLVGFFSYIGMVTGRIRFVGDSFAIPNEMISLIFAYSVVLFPWLILSIIYRGDS